MTMRALSTKTVFVKCWATPTHVVSLNLTKQIFDVCWVPMSLKIILNNNNAIIN